MKQTIPESSSKRYSDQWYNPALKRNTIKNKMIVGVPQNISSETTFPIKTGKKRDIK